MPENKFAQKMRFLSLFPYGFSSHSATLLTGKANPYAQALLLGPTPEDTIAQNEKYKHKFQEKMNYERRKGLIEDRTWKCGTPPTERTFRVLTKVGLATITEAWAEATEAIVEGKVSISPNNGKIKAVKSLSSSKQMTDLQELLNIYTDDKNDYDARMFSDILLEAVIDGNVTPISQALPVVPYTKISTRKYSPNQIYNIWRTSHITTMFRLNDHLTYMDRRPYDTGFAVDGIRDEASYHAYINRHGHTVASLTYYALTRWYRANPGYYQITQQYPDESEEAKAAWISTPAYYATAELPGLERSTETDNITQTHGSKQKFKTVCVGLATGKKQNYVVYHGTAGEFKWNPKREQITRDATEQSIHAMKTLNSDIPYNNKVNYGLIFCSSHHQFITIFDRAKERHRRKLRGKNPTDNPYTSLHVIPVNDAGCFLLWLLMELSPGEAELFICKRLVAQDSNFQHQTNLYYPLTYQGIRVFPGYTMNVSKINHVLEDYLNGHSFYLCCFPEQAKWYRKLFPGITIL